MVVRSTPALSANSCAVQFNKPRAALICAGVMAVTNTPAENSRQRASYGLAVNPHPRPLAVGELDASTLAPCWGKCLGKLYAEF